MGDAERDPFYSRDVDLRLPDGLDTLEGAMQERNLLVPQRPKLELDLNAIAAKSSYMRANNSVSINAPYPPSSPK
jgi:hypothetical protein